MEKYKFLRSEYKRPPAALKSVDLALGIFDDRIEGRETLAFRAEEALGALELDARDLDVRSAALVSPRGAAPKPLACVFEKQRAKLTVFLPRVYKRGERFSIAIAATCRPSAHILDGVYFDATPPGEHPPQLISQCQQWGFQRIMPIVDDCTAKAVWRVSLEADARYTHIIANGDLEREEPAAGGARRRVVYVNRIPMPPYLFLLAAGTYEALADSVTLPSGRVVRLEYLVPPGRADGAREPMRILKDAVAWQARRLGFEYGYDCYRTICMEKSNFGGMENTGNTTIITEAALLDRWTPDRRIVYAYGVIIHEFEHSHCGSGVTMETPFDMWLNEAFTVNVEREFVASRFGAAESRLDDLDAMRSPLRGPLAAEDGGDPGLIVREGFNDPDDVVDGVTYVKAPEVLGMLRSLMGENDYEKAARWHFKKYDGGNADTARFLAAFQRFSKRGLAPFFSEWLFAGGYPAISCSWRYSEKTHTVSVALSQRRHGGGAGTAPRKRRAPFVVPFRFAAFTAGGAPLASANMVLESRKAVFRIPDVPERPAFVDWNGGDAFYGVISDLSSDAEALHLAARFSPNLVSRAEAKRRLDDEMMKRALSGAAPKAQDGDFARWLALHAEILSDGTLPDGVKARMLSVPEEMLDRAFLPLAAGRAAAARRLRAALARHIGEAALLSAFAAACDPSVENSGKGNACVENGCAGNACGGGVETLPRAVARRALCGALSRLLAEIATPAAIRAFENLFHNAQCVSDMANAALALAIADAPSRAAVMAEFGDAAAPHPGAYGEYLRVLGSRPCAAVFADAAKEEKRARFKMEHPGHSRALYGALAANNHALWTRAGLRWAERTIAKLSPINENSAAAVLAAFQQSANMPEPLRGAALLMLRRLETRVPESAASLRAKITRALGSPRG